VKGKLCVVTGANSGIGRVTARELAKRGARVVLAARSRERTEPALEEVRRAAGADAGEFLQLDLSRLDAVRAAAAELLDRGHPIHVLINNAGLAGNRGRTRDGFELAFGVNHLGHFLFTNLLLDRLRASAPARVVTVASTAHKVAKGIDFDAVRRRTTSVTAFPEYGVSKLANILFSAELGRRLAGSGVTTYALHPGVIASGIWRNVPWPLRPLIRLFMKSNEEGAATTLWCATGEDLADESGGYYDEMQRARPSAIAEDERLARELWQRSARWCGLEASEPVVSG
jgi:NAD(P)-dependent dehydrogenase (short-subunit alcohol dehydrogenase family)